MKQFICLLWLFFSSICFASNPPNGLPNSLNAFDYGEVQNNTTIVEADGYYPSYNNNESSRKDPPSGYYNKWISTNLPIIKGQGFSIKVSGYVARIFNTIIDFDPKIQAPQNQIKFQKGDSFELLINNKSSDGSSALNYVNEGCDIFTYPANTNSDTSAECNMYNAKNVCRKSASDEAICTNKNGNIYGNWGIGGSGLKIWYGENLINDNDKSFEKQKLVNPSIGSGVFGKQGFYVANLVSDGILTFKALDSCDGSNSADYKLSSNNNNSSCFSKNIGNYAFNIKKIFNPVYNANTEQNGFGSLDYTISSDDPNLTADSNLTIVNFIAVAGTSYNSSANSSGKLWLRVHDEKIYDPTISKNQDALNYFNSKFDNNFPSLNNYYFNKIGRYIVDVGSVTATTDNTLSNLINKIVQPIKDAFTDASQKMYQKIIGNGSFKNLIKYSLILYIIVYAICFTLGMVQVTQQDLVTRIVKMGIVFALITSSTSWYFFNDYLFNMFLKGSEDLIKIYTGGSPSDSSSNVFRFIDISLGKFFTRYTWTKMSAILFHPVGFLVVAMMLYGIFIYIVCMIEMILGYLLALAAISFTIAIAPLFIICILFERTKSYFDNWMKYLLSFALQPVILFAAVYLVYDLVMITFAQAIGYNITWKVAFEVRVWIINFDIYWYVATGVADTSVGQLYANIFISGLIFMMLIKVLRGMLDLAPTITAYIISTNSAPASITGQGSQARGQMDMAKNLAKKASGMDAASKATRKEDSAVAARKGGQ